MNRRGRIQRTLEYFINIVSLALAHGLSVLLFGIIIQAIDPRTVYDRIEYGVALFCSATIIFFWFSSPLNLVKRGKSEEFMSTLRNCVLTYGLFWAILILVKNPFIDSRYLFVSSFTFYVAFSLVLRYILKHYLLGLITRSKFASHVGVISTYGRACEFLPKLHEDWSKNIIGIALVDAEFNNNGFVLQNGEAVFDVDAVPVVANRDSLIGWIRTSPLDEIYINLPDFQSLSGYDELIEEIEDMGVTVYVNIPSLETVVEKSKFDNLNCAVSFDYPMAELAPTVIAPYKLVLKRIVDIIGGIVGCVLSLPIILIVAIPLKLESKGPLIFKQERVGRNGRTFYIYKLRSMYQDAEERKKALMEQNKMDGHMFKMDNDPRITKVGKFIRKTSIDELPQFWNVLKGDMSLVGTRPPTVDEYNKYESHHKRRLSLKPGITGKWQISGRSDIQDFEEVVRLDCEYIDEWSPMLDVRILIKTVGVVLTHKGAE